METQLSSRKSRKHFARKSREPRSVPGEITGVPVLPRLRNRPSQTCWGPRRVLNPVTAAGRPAFGLHHRTTRWLAVALSLRRAGSLTAGLGAPRSGRQEERQGGQREALASGSTPITRNGQRLTTRLATLKLPRGADPPGQRWSTGGHRVEAPLAIRAVGQPGGGGSLRQVTVDIWLWAVGFRSHK